jgi:hypothetical protein
MQPTEESFFCLGPWASYCVESYTWPNRQVLTGVILLFPTNCFLRRFPRSLIPEMHKPGKVRRSWDLRACRRGGLADARAWHIGRSTPAKALSPRGRRSTGPRSSINHLNTIDLRVSPLPPFMEQSVEGEGARRRTRTRTSRTRTRGRPGLWPRASIPGREDVVIGLPRPRTTAARTPDDRHEERKWGRRSKREGYAARLRRGSAGSERWYRR